MDILDANLKNNKILIVCENGVNRSSSLVIVYAILRNDYFNDINYLINYVDEEKIKKI